MKATFILALVGVYLLTLCHGRVTEGEIESSFKYNDAEDVDAEDVGAEDAGAEEAEEIDAEEAEEIDAEDAESQQTEVSFLPSGNSMGPKIKIEFIPGNSGSYGGSGGTTYIRWGKTECPSTDGTQLLYKGRAAGSHYTHRGGAADYLCLPENPEFLSSKNGGHRSTLYQAEYETQTGPSLQSLQNYEVPCATCISTKRGTKLMIPGRITCLKGWTREYYGYLMSAVQGHHRTRFTCMDVNAEGVPGTSKDINGALFYFVEVLTGSFPSSYTNGNEMTCVVCTK